MSGIAMTVLVRNDGTLTADGEALVKYLRADFAEIGDDLDKLPDEHRRAYHVLVSRDRDVTPAQFFTAYPRSADHLWFTYAANLPDDNPRKVAAQVESVEQDEPTHEEAIESLRALKRKLMPLFEAYQDADAPQSLAESIRKLERFFSSSPLVEGVGHFAQLTRHGEWVMKELSAALKEGAAIEAAYLEALRAFAAYTVQHYPNQPPLMTPAQFLSEFRSSAAQLHTLVYRLLEARADRLEQGVKRARLGTVSTTIVRL
jgi:hypothetical protein